MCQIVKYKNPIIQKDILSDFISKIGSLKNIHKIVIDGNKDRKYENKLKKLLKNKNIKFYKLKYIDDKQEPLLRLTDFMAGMFRSFVDNKNIENIYIHALLCDKIKTPD